MASVICQATDPVAAAERSLEQHIMFTCSAVLQCSCCAMLLGEPSNSTSTAKSSTNAGGWKRSADGR